MIIDDKTIKRKNKKIKKDKVREYWNKRRVRKRVKKVIKMLQNKFVNSNDVNVQLDATLISFDLKPVLDEMSSAKLIKYVNEGSIYRIKILTAEDIFAENNAKLQAKDTKKSYVKDDFHPVDELETVKINLDEDIS